MMPHKSRKIHQIRYLLRNSLRNRYNPIRIHRMGMMQTRYRSINHLRDHQSPKVRMGVVLFENKKDFFFLYRIPIVLSCNRILPTFHAGTSMRGGRGGIPRRGSSNSGSYNSNISVTGSDVQQCKYRFFTHSSKLNCM